MKTLTESSTFTATVVVPEGDDPRDTAAEDVEAIAQALTNRTKYLNDKIPNTVFKDAVSIITGLLRLNPADVTDPAFEVVRTPTAGGWQLLTHMPLVSGQRLRMYYADGVLGFFILTVNGSWIPGSPGHWIQDNNTVRSRALVINPGGTLAYYSRLAGAANWAEWGTGTGDDTSAQINAPVMIAGESLATSVAYGQRIESLSNVKAATDVESQTITCHTNATIEGDAYVQGDYRFTAAQSFTTAINICASSGPSRYTPENGVGFLPDYASFKTICFAVALPPRCTVNQVRVRHWQGTTTPDSFTLRKRIHNFSGTPTIDDSRRQTANATISSSKVTAITGPSGAALAMDVSPSDEISIVWELGDFADFTAIGINQILAMEIDWTRGIL